MREMKKDFYFLHLQWYLEHIIQGWNMMKWNGETSVGYKRNRNAQWLAERFAPFEHIYNNFLYFIGILCDRLRKLCII